MFELTGMVPSGSFKKGVPMSNIVRNRITAQPACAIAAANTVVAQLGLGSFISDYYNLNHEPVISGRLKGCTSVTIDGRTDYSAVFRVQCIVVTKADRNGFPVDKIHVIVPQYTHGGSRPKPRFFECSFQQIPGKPSIVTVETKVNPTIWQQKTLPPRPRVGGGGGGFFVFFFFFFFFFIFFFE